MLLEKYNRILTIAMEALMQDFEPRDAIPYMCADEIFNDDQQEIILAMPRRALRVLEFVRQYRKTANDLKPLIAYFERYGQKHLASILSKQYVPNERPLLTQTELENRLFVDGNVPKPPFYRQNRTDLLQNLEKLLIDLSLHEQFWLVIHGFPGCGKSFLAADVLYTCPVLLSRHYEHVIWISDGRTDVSHLPELFSNFVFLASDALVLTGNEAPTQFLPLAKAALREKPNALVVLDDVYLRESVRWFDQLNCRIVATSRNLEIFQVCSTNPIHFTIQPPSFSLTEMRNMLSEKTPIQNSSSYMEQLYYIHRKTTGLPALIGILRQQLCDSAIFDDLSGLNNYLNHYAIATLSHFTYYKFENMVDAIMESYKLLTERQKRVMETFVLFGPDQWIPLELLSLCIEMDIAGEQDTVYMALQELEPLTKTSLLDKRATGPYSIDGDRPVYDFHIIPIMHSFLCVTVDRQELEDRLHLFIRPHVSSFLNDHKSVNSDFMHRIRSFVDPNPSLFDRIPYEECRTYFKQFQMHVVNERNNKCNTNYKKEGSEKNCYNNNSRWTDSCIFM